MDPLAHLTKQKQELQTANIRRLVLLGDKLNLESSISNQHDESSKLRGEHTVMKLELTKGIPHKASVAAEAAKVSPDFRNQFVFQVTKALQAAVEHDLSSLRFKLIESDNKILNWQQSLDDVKTKLTQLDRTIIKLNRKVNSAKLMVKRSIERLQTRLCPQS